MGSNPGLALSLILGAAFLHALWNALVKGSADRVLTMGLINLGHVAVGVVMVALYLPPAEESWPFLVASTLIHWFYYGFLILAYRHGDLSQVYPIARGAAPVMVALGAQVFAGEVLSATAWIGILTVSLGISLLFLGQQPGRTSGKAVAAALLTGVTIASYSVVDGIGVRLSVNPLGYIGWLFLLEGFATVGFFALRIGVLTELPRRTYLWGIAGGVISSLAYGLAIYAKQLTTLGTVSAIRESSVVIAALIGVIWFNERPWKLRLAAAGVVCGGVILLAWAEL
ncbi:MAG: EamA family transporter [Pseudomonadota bacterium]